MILRRIRGDAGSCNEPSDAKREGRAVRTLTESAYLLGCFGCDANGRPPLSPTLSPAYDLNPTPIDEKARLLSTNIDLDKGTCSLDLVLEAAGYFNLKRTHARTIVREVGAAVATWREVAAEVGARAHEIERMASAFEHDDLARARAL